jgi:CRISPR system Cascade subunit CasB
MSDERFWEDRFLGRLRALAPSDDKKDWDRGVLAELRRGLGKELSHVLSRQGRLFPMVPDFALHDAVLVACLFAMHPDPGGEGTLGSAFRQIRDESGSIEKRFVALLDADREDLADHLRHNVSLLRAKNVVIDWARLLRDLRGWNHESRFVQIQWSRDFWWEERPEQPDITSEPASA